MMRHSVSQGWAMQGLFSWLLGRPRGREPAWIEPADLKRRLDAADPLLVLDVRGPDEFSGELGHIDGAVNLPLPELPARVEELAADRRLVVCVCLTDKRSSQAAATIATAGHGDVAVLRGGMQRWRREGFIERQ
jgi:rhodanese-related sulfurtransferase